MAITTGTGLAVAGLAAGAGTAYAAHRASRGGSGPGVPDYGANYRDALQAEIDLMGPRLEAEREYGPGFDAIQTESAERTAREMSRIMLELEQEYGPQYIEQARENIRLSDPEGWEARMLLHEMVMRDAERGGELSPDERREVQQAVRGGQVARGNVLGDAAAFEEAMETGDAAWRRQQQRMGNLASFTQGATPQAQFGQISRAQQGASPFAPVGGPVTDPNRTAQAAGQIHGTQAGLHQAYLNRPNPWMQAAGMITGAGAQMAGAYISGPMSVQAYQQGGGGQTNPWLSHQAGGGWMR
jgi:hypothetical protein